VAPGDDVGLRLLPLIDRRSNLMGGCLLETEMCTAIQPGPEQAVAAGGGGRAEPLPGPEGAAALSAP